MIRLVICTSKRALLDLKLWDTYDDEPERDTPPVFAVGFGHTETRYQPDAETCDE